MKCQVFFIFFSQKNIKTKPTFRKLSACLAIYLFACWVILHAFLSSVEFLFKYNFFFKNIFQEYHQSVKQFGSRSGPAFLKKLSADD